MPAVEGDLSCEYCHTDSPHVGGEATDYHLNKHAEHVACQTCHIPEYSRINPTKVNWDWSQAGKKIKPEKDSLGMPTYDKKKGAFKWVKAAKPAFRWYNGTVKRHLLGDRIEGHDPVELAAPVGQRKDPASRIYPFKVHRGKQPADAMYKHLIAPKLFGGFWKDWDWDKAAKDGMKSAGLPYSGKIEFVETVMYWGLTHEVAPKEKSLSCAGLPYQPGPRTPPAGFATSPARAWITRNWPPGATGPRTGAPSLTSRPWATPMTPSRAADASDAPCW